MKKLKKFMECADVLSQDEMKYLKGGANWLCIDADGHETCLGNTNEVVHNPSTDCYSISISCDTYNDVGPSTIGD